MSDLPKKVAEIEIRILNEEKFDDFEGQGVKIIISSNIIDICFKFQVLLGIKLFGHTDTLAEAFNLKKNNLKGWNTKWTTISKCSCKI